MLKFALDHVVDLLAVAGALTVAAGVIARLTPNKKDDAVVAFVQNMLEKAGSLFLKPSPKK